MRKKNVVHTGWKYVYFTPDIEKGLVRNVPQHENMHSSSTFE